MAAATTVAGMRAIQKVTAAAAASLFGRKLEHLKALDLVVPDLTPADLAQLSPEQLRRHLACQLIAATLQGVSSFQLVQQFCTADYRCDRPLLTPVEHTPAHQQLTLVSVPRPKAARGRKAARTRAA